MQVKNNYIKIHNKYKISGLVLKEFCSVFSYSYAVISRNFKTMGLPLTNSYKGKIKKELIMYIHKEMKRTGQSLSFYAKKYSVSRQELYRTALRYNLKISSSRVTSVINPKFFNNITTELQAYLLGWLFSDGNVETSSNTISISLQKKDIDILLLFKSVLGGNIYYSKIRNINVFRVGNKDLKVDLIALGCVPNKSYKKLIFPSLKYDLVRHFIRGFFDGDGSIFKSARNKTIRFYCTSKDFLFDIESFLLSQGVPNIYWGTGKKESNFPVHRLTIGNEQGRQQIKKLFYENSIYWLARKKEKFDMYVNTEVRVANKKAITP